MAKLIQRAALVYQAGIANVFAVKCFNAAPEGRNAVRLWQGDFRACEMFARGMAVAGSTVRVFCCNMAGDISERQWSSDLESAPFSDKFIPPGGRKAHGLEVAGA